MLSYQWKHEVFEVYWNMFTKNTCQISWLSCRLSSQSYKNMGVLFKIRLLFFYNAINVQEIVLKRIRLYFICSNVAFSITFSILLLNAQVWFYCYFWPFLSKQWICRVLWTSLDNVNVETFQGQRRSVMKSFAFTFLALEIHTVYLGNENLYLCLIIIKGLKNIK